VSVAQLSKLACCRRAKIESWATIGQGIFQSKTIIGQLQFLN
jgi:hypothetical protein